MYYVIAKRQASYGDELVEEDFDFDHPIGTYAEDDLSLASQHAHAHTMNHGVSTIVVKEEDMENVRKSLPMIGDGVEPVNPTDWKDIN
jgi:hypothetical protein